MVTTSKKVFSLDFSCSVQSQNEQRKIFFVHTKFFIYKKIVCVRTFGRSNFYAKLVWHKNCFCDKIDFVTNLANCELAKKIKSFQILPTPDTEGAKRSRTKCATEVRTKPEVAGLPYTCRP